MVQSSTGGIPFAKEHDEVIQSSSGGIPLEQVVVEDYITSDDDIPQETAQEAMERISVNKAVKIAFAQNKCDSDELIKLRGKWQAMVSLLKKRGISLVDLEKEQIEGEGRFNTGGTNYSEILVGRDDFGLPTHNKKNYSPVKGRGVGETPNEAKMFDKRSEQGKTTMSNDNPGIGVSGVKDDLGKEKAEKAEGYQPLREGMKKSWANVLKDDNVKLEDNKVKFDYFPVSSSGIVEPPVEVL